MGYEAASLGLVWHGLTGPMVILYLSHRCDQAHNC